MEILFVALFLLVLVAIVIYDCLEISLLKYGMAKAMAMHSQSVKQTLDAMLTGKVGFKITNKEFRKIEKTYLASLNSFLIRRCDAHNDDLRKEILECERLEL